MRWICLLLALGIVACGGDDDGTQPFPSERFEGLWSLQSVEGQPLPLEVITPSGTYMRHEMTLEVSADKYLPEGEFTDSLLQTVEEPGGGTAVENHSIHMHVLGFVSGDTALFVDDQLEDGLFRFLVENGAEATRLRLDRTPLDEVWTRR